MGTTPAAHLARLKITYRDWSIHAIEPDKGNGYTAKRRTERSGVRSVYAPTLGAAHQQLAGPLVVVWDNLNAHVSGVMADLIAARDWLTVYRLPPYAHELNPVEPVWSHLKRSLANLAKQNLAQLTALIKTRLKRMQYRPGLLDGFLASTRLGLAFS